MRHVCFALLASACVSSSTEIGEDLGAFDPGKADFQGIEVPLRLSGNEIATYTLTVNGPFELLTKYPQDVEIMLDASDGAASHFTTTGREPSLVVEAPVEVTTHYQLTITNKAPFTTVNGLLRVQSPMVVCDDAVWTAWLETFAAKLAGAGLTIDANEQAVLDVIAEARPCDATSDAAYGAWITHFEAQLVATGSAIDAQERKFVDNWLAVRPDSRGEGAFLAWHPAFVKWLDATNGVVDQTEQVYLDLLVDVRPPAVGDAAYVAWVEHFETLVVATGTTIDLTEDAFLRQALRGKPCATGATALAAWNDLVLAAPGNASELLTLARPIAGCQ